MIWLVAGSLLIAGAWCYALMTVLRARGPVGDDEWERFE